MSIYNTVAQCLASNGVVPDEFKRSYRRDIHLHQILSEAYPPLLRWVYLEHGEDASLMVNNGMGPSTPIRHMLIYTRDRRSSDVRECMRILLQFGADTLILSIKGRVRTALDTISDLDHISHFGAADVLIEHGVSLQDEYCVSNGIMNRHIVARIRGCNKCRRVALAFMGIKTLPRDIRHLMARAVFSTRMADEWMDPAEAVDKRLRG